MFGNQVSNAQIVVSVLRRMGGIWCDLRFTIPQARAMIAKHGSVLESGGTEIRDVMTELGCNSLTTEEELIMVIELAAEKRKKELVEKRKKQMV